MNARDLMTEVPTTVSPEHSVWHAAQIMLSEPVSGVPVLTNDGVLTGIVTEGDLLGRTELGTAEVFPDPVQDADAVARPYGKSRSWKVGDVMTTNVIMIEQNAAMHEIATVIEQHGIQRLPVKRENRLVGIVSRADLLEVIATGKPDADIRGDEAVRAPLLRGSPKPLRLYQPSRSSSSSRAGSCMSLAMCGPKTSMVRFAWSMKVSPDQGSRMISGSREKTSCKTAILRCACPQKRASRSPPF